MKVWLVMGQHDYEGSDVVSVHASEAGAQKEAARLVKRMGRAQQVRADYWSLEEPPEGKEPKWPEGVPDCDSIWVNGPYSVKPAPPAKGEEPRG